MALALSEALSTCIFNQSTPFKRNSTNEFDSFSPRVPSKFSVLEPNNLISFSSIALLPNILDNSGPMLFLKRFNLTPPSNILSPYLLPLILFLSDLPILSPANANREPEAKEEALRALDSPKPSSSSVKLSIPSSRNGNRVSVRSFKVPTY